MGNEVWDGKGGLITWALISKPKNSTEQNMDSTMARDVAKFFRMLSAYFTTGKRKNN